EKMVALAIKCEYKDDDTACSELESMKPTQGDGFAKSFIPDFLMDLFSKKQDMIEYNSEPSDGVPEECWNENDKPECEQYKYLKETRLDWDAYGNFIGTNRARGLQESVPTMQESIPQCYDENDNFLEEKCGKITVVRNEQGLVNYLIEKEMENIIDKLENKSEQNTIDINGTGGRTIIDGIKEEIDGIEGQIVERTFAPGTEGTGDGVKDIKTVVVEEGKDVSGDDGLTPEVKIDVAGGGNNVVEGGGNNVVEGGGNNVIDNVIVEDGKNNVIDEPPKHKDNEDVSPQVNVVDNEVDDGPGEPGVVDED
ncbi:MAG: hypothetical protein ABIB71_08870, partial [Candidatus Woesearchaeota archaeon]